MLAKLFGRRRKFKAVIFDIGGVLVDADLERYAVYGADIFGCRPDEVQQAAQPLVPELETGQLTSLQFWERLGQALGREVPARKFEGFWKGLLRDSVRVNQPVLDLLPRIQRQASLGALSNTIDEHAAYFQKIGVYDLFRECVLSYQVGMRKPDPAIYRLAASRLNATPAECFFIDDSRVNVDGALAVGMPAHEFTDVGDLVADLGASGLL